MLSHYPHVEKQFIHPDVEEEIEWLKKIVQAIRTIRSEMGISPAKLIPLTLRNASPVIQARIEKYMQTLTTLCKVAHVHYLQPGKAAPLSASAVIGDLELLIPMAGIIDKEAELVRLEKEIGKLDKDIKLAEGKLDNPAFSEKAPADIIAKEQEKLAQARMARGKLLEHRMAIEGL
jgi:valyl-tRNA synthetase